MPTKFLSTERIDHAEGLNNSGFECFSMHADGFAKLTGPGIYAVMHGTGDDLEVLYIGSAKNVLARISDPEHKSLREAMQVKGAKLLISVCSSEKNARGTEADLISICQPKLNIMGKSPNSHIAKAIKAANG